MLGRPKEKKPLKETLEDGARESATKIEENEVLENLGAEKLQLNGSCQQCQKSQCYRCQGKKKKEIECVH